MSRLSGNHAEPKFFDIHIASESRIAAEALQRTAALYAIEAKVCDTPAEVRGQVRQDRDRPRVKAMHTWLGEQLPTGLRAIRRRPGDPLCLATLAGIDPVPGDGGWN